ncbi:hypothetical protein K1T71_006666 [Dendrolimus kikuchii]|uniref:Uncharacterized protein n=1 Tax=Dendrolimus kikuchii TaxID=765133 RepID=A0ACC1D2I0_9NEOP|nr:hypothetical protein K1T71_006666 [Dendrolimus kikuchii]
MKSFLSNINNLPSTWFLTEWINLFLLLKYFYLDKKFPKYTDLYLTLKKDFEKRGLTCEIKFEKFVEELNLIGLTYQKIPDGRSLVMENPEVTFKRVLYLNKIKKVRAIKGKHVYYLDVRIIDDTCTFKKPEAFTNIDKMLLYTVISSRGLVATFFCNKLTLDTYNNWMTNVVLHQIEPSSVIVVNNKILASSQYNIVTGLDTKQNMLKWLNNNNIPCSSNLLKAELYELISRYPKTIQESTVERIFMAKGHVIYQLPSGIETLTPIEMMWDLIREKLQNKETFDCYTLKELILTIIRKEQSQQFSFWGLKIIDLENQIFKLDLEIQEALESYLEMSS